MRHAKRTDANHAAIRDGLRERGYEVLDLSAAGQGVPDLCVRINDERGMAFVPRFLEVKDGAKPPSARALSEAEIEWSRWCWRITSTVTSLEEALEALK